MNGNTQSCIAVIEVCTCDQWHILAGSVRQWECRWSSFHSPAECNTPQAKSEVCKVLDWTHQQKFRSRKCTYLHGKNLYICLWGSYMESSFVIMLVLLLLDGQSCICLWCQEFWHQTFNVHFYSMASQTYQSPTTNPFPSVKGQKKAPHHAGSDELGLQWDIGHLTETIARLCEQSKICGYCTNHLLRATTATASNGNNGSFISQWGQELWAYQWDAWQSLTCWVSNIRSNSKDHVHTQPHRLCMHLQLQVLQTCFSSCQNITIIFSGAKELWSDCASMCMYIVYSFCILLSSHTYHIKHLVKNSTYICPCKLVSIPNRRVE